MEEADLLQKLHPLEREIIPFLVDGISTRDLEVRSGLEQVEVMRAVQWLSNKGILKTSEKTREQVFLDANGIEYAKLGLPEIRLLKSIPAESFRQAERAMQEAGISSQELGISLGTLKAKAAIIADKPGGVLSLKRTENGSKLLEKESLESRFLGKKFPVYLDSLTPEERFAYDALVKRMRILKTVYEKTITISITEIGVGLLKAKGASKVDVGDSITHEMLVSGSWKSKSFRHYDIVTKVPKICGAKRHFVRQSIDYIKKVWLELGFKEMQGTIVQSAFWDLDALFVPQDHPARTMQDTFYIDEPKYARLPTNMVKKVKAVHENGADTGSRGWGGKWSEKEASLNMLRTHTTPLSARTIAKLKKEEMPAKFFSVNKVYRNEALTWKHLFELHQVEGIVIDPNATLSHLKGYLAEFYRKLGYENVRMRPAHFPYTEPSLEVDVFHPEKKQWVELGGAGIFRPEVVKTLLGIDVPVLAWGQGLERGIMGYYGFKDIRQLYSNDLGEIKSVKIWR